MREIAVAVRRFSKRGGLEKNVFAIIQHLAGRGHKVRVLAHRLEAELPSGATFEPVPAPALFGEAARMLWFSRAVQKRLAQRPAEVSFTASHVAGPEVVRLDGGLALAYEQALKRIPSAVPGLEPTWRLPEKAALHIEEQKLVKARRVICLSNRMTEDLKTLYRLPVERLAVIGNGIDLTNHRPIDLEERRAARTQWRLEGPTLAFVGSGFYRKGLDLLIVALAAMRHPPHLLVAGHDRQQERYERLASDLQVPARFVGYLPDPRPVWAASDALALPARYEPFGLVALEAWAHGLPTLLSENVGAAELAEPSDLVLFGSARAVDWTAALGPFVERLGDGSLRKRPVLATSQGRGIAQPDMLHRIESILLE
jgi:UDP-glucose:(heptosyl)LPS alpha-1,3-glucosyltransferase